MRNALMVLVLVAWLNPNDVTASVFEYSYTFNDGWRVSGSLRGDEIGLYVVNVTNVTLLFDCPSPSCAGPTSEPDGLPIFSMAWDYSIHFWDKALAPVVSFVASLNNFQFINQPNYPPDFNSATLRYFEMHPIDPGYPFDLPPVSGQDSTVFRGDGDAALNGSWRLVRVPEPSPLEELNTLLASVTSIGPGRSLAKKVELALASYIANDIDMTCVELGDFINEVQAQRAKKITSDQTQQLVADANAIILAIHCN